MAEKYGMGYLYADSVGIAHVVEDLELAKRKAKAGVFEYHGFHDNGYPVDSFGNKLFITNLPGIDMNDKHKYKKKIRIPLTEVK